MITKPVPTVVIKGLILKTLTKVAFIDPIAVPTAMEPKRANIGDVCWPMIAAITAQNANPELIERSNPPAKMTRVMPIAMMPAGDHCESILFMFAGDKKAGLPIATITVSYTHLTLPTKRIV